jgi:2-(1,2-epoxy-1,2-dihydrophenyl)acetyl-CoA isomerase
MEESVRVDMQGGICRLTLNRPDRLNALTPDMLDRLRRALTEAEEKAECRAVLLTGSGRGFCAGQDLGGTDWSRTDPGDLLEQHYNRLVRQLRTIPLPVVCAVNGVAAGAGANLALACDIVLAARSARFSQAFVKIGLVPDSGGTFFLPRLIGEARARALALLGDTIEAERAASWGMIWKAVEDAELMPEAQRLAAMLAEAPTQAIGLIKQALDASAANGLDRQLDLERDLQRAAARTPDFREGVRAFAEKRPPIFTGRPA